MGAREQIENHEDEYKNWDLTSTLITKLKMKHVWPALLTLFLLFAILTNAQSTEETLPSTESEPSEASTEDDQPEKPTENPEPSSPSAQDDDQPEEPTKDDEESSAPDDNDDAAEASTEKPSKEGGKEPSEKGSYAATYQEIVKILNSVDFKAIEDLHLQRMLENAFQARVRNPILDQTAQIADFSAVS